MHAHTMDIQVCLFINVLTPGTASSGYGPVINNADYMKLQFTCTGLK